MAAPKKSTDIIVVGAGLAGLVATVDLAQAGHRVILLDQESESSLGGQAFWSFGGLFLVDSPEQRRLRIRDSAELAMADWLNSAGFDRAEDRWPLRWAEAYVEFAAGEARTWLHGLGVRFFPVVQWAERGGGSATGHGNSVPRFHVTWGTGPGLLEPFIRRAKELADEGKVAFKPRHRVTELVTERGTVTGVSGDLLEPSPTPRGEPSSRTVVGEFQLDAQAVIIAAGGIGGNHDLIRRHWPQRLGKPPTRMLSGVPDHVDGAMLKVAAAAGGNLINLDRMWHYPEGLHDHTPIWSHHGIRILSGPSPLWLDATGTQLPAPLFPGFDSLGALAHIRRSGHDHSWFLLNQRTIETEFALSGSEQNPDLTGRSVRLVLRRALPGAVGPVAAFQRRGQDFVMAENLPDVVAGMNRLVGADLVDTEALREQVIARDLQVNTGLGKDAQLAAINAARRYIGDRLIRVVKPHRLLDPKAGPLIAVRLSILTRKTLGGLETDLSGRVLRADGEPVPGLFAAGEVTGFGGGGVHGYRALEGTFLGGCLFSGRVAAHGAAASFA